MQNAITTLRIQNFKSIKDVTMQPRRVNIIIGEPNVGKSNILEALSLLGGMVYDKSPRFMDGMIRYTRINQLYYDNLSVNSIYIKSNNAGLIMRAGRQPGSSQALYMSNDTLKRICDTQLRYRLDSSANGVWASAFSEVVRTGKLGGVAFDGTDALFGFRSINDSGTGPDGVVGFEKSSAAIEKEVIMRPYLFKKDVDVGRELGIDYLYPPYGANLKNIIQGYASFRQQIAKMFHQYGLKLSLRMLSDGIEVVKEVNDLIYSYLYNNIADTLQRLIFYLAAIESNDDAVLLFEEPEAHSFPSYIMQLAQSIVDSRNNQFFVVTHNPYLLTEILEEMLPDDELKPELSIFAAYYEDYQTKVHQLTDEEMISARADGLDFFLNLRRFVPEAE